MAFQDKFRAFQAGLPLGVPAFKLAGEKVLFLHCAPMELSDALLRWLMLHDDLVHMGSPGCALRFDELHRAAMTWPVWRQFLDWMAEQIDVGTDRGARGGSQGASGDATWASAFALGEGIAAGVPRRELHGEQVLYLDEAPMEFRPALRHWLDAVAPAEARYDESGRAALTWWDGWEAFISWVQNTLSGALHCLETDCGAEDEN
ncbi:hypothetical protein SAMN05414139_02332 [Burkholderia sp. D7]|nr:hypothetical protein SAMN05414139_02332 [Burkholderia sp. D7]